MGQTIAMVFPHQLFASHPAVNSDTDSIYMVEDSLFFGDAQYPQRFHVQKLAFLRAAMKAYAEKLHSDACEVEYFPYAPDEQPLKQAIESIDSKEGTQLICVEPVDFILSRRLQQLAEQSDIALKWLPSPQFLTSEDDNTDWRQQNKRWYMARYYQWQRQRLDVLMEGSDPVGGEWSFDTENRKKLPKKMLGQLPDVTRKTLSTLEKDALEWAKTTFPKHPGECDTLYYPTTHEAATAWLDTFLAERLMQFGPYEDAIVEGERWLYHGVLTPMMNCGLLTPQQVLDATLHFAEEHDVPLNSLEGFVRQIIGWREFMRATYMDLGVTMRTRNHWKHERPMPDAFYTANTGIAPVDDVIQKVLETGYCHHIERLMVLGGFMFLCEISPDAVYTWFMDMFIDSYDWVMVPNVYAMSQHADGGLITTKPYFSGSNYIIKMSHYKKSEWSDIWDALFWRFMLKYRDELAGNPRWAMLCKQAEKFDESKQSDIKRTAEAYLQALFADDAD